MLLDMKGRYRFVVSPIKCIILAITSFLIVSTMVRLVIYPRLGQADALTQKMALAVSEPRIDVLFAGPSYTEGGIDPHIFDEEMAKLGYRFRSFNVAAGGLGIIEIEQTVDTTINSGNCCQYVFITPSFYLFNIAANSYNLRSIIFLDFVHALREIMFMAWTPAVPRERITRPEYIRNIIEATLRHYTNIGIASNSQILNWFSDGGRSRSWDWDKRGFVPLRDRLNQRQAEYEIAMDDIRAKRPGLINRASTQTQPRYEVTISASMMDDIIRFGRKLEDKGMTPLLLIAPETSYWDWDAEFGAKFEARCGASHLFNYNDPFAFPELFAPDVRADGGHLNEVGAPVWTRLVARRLGQQLSDHQLTKPFCLH